MMKLCLTDNTADRLNEIHDVIDFICDAICIGRDLPFDDTALCGLQRVIWAVQNDLKTLENAVRDSSEFEPSAGQHAARNRLMGDVLGGHSATPSEHIPDTLCKHPVNGVGSTQGESVGVRSTTGVTQSSKRLSATNPVPAI